MRRTCRQVGFAEIIGRETPYSSHRPSAAPDEVFVAAIEGGGVISYRKEDGSFIHTLNTNEGFGRKLAQLGIELPGG